MGMAARGARSGAPDLGQGLGRALGAMSLQERAHYVVPSQQGDNLEVPQRRDQLQSLSGSGRLNASSGLPGYYNQYDGMPVPYSAPSAGKENMIIRSAVRDAANAEIMKSSGNAAPGVIRTDPITDAEVAYVKSMKDMTELAKFDKYVETYIDPRKPGNMKWLMEIYPDYVERRLQQAHTDYEYALRNQMIDQWGINTFDDLHFKYLVDQGEVKGPRLQTDRAAVDSTYTPGWLSPFNFQSPNRGGKALYLPFARAQHGRRPFNPDDWAYDREVAKDPLGTGNTPQDLARGMYAGDPSDGDQLNARGRQMAITSGSNFGLFDALSFNPMGALTQPPT
ncbi:MAG: hypothetical protein CMJ58_09110 [Planctomycetaceae bacterium]|nr:hypothetical protein [Planctomycetaceae bacterium]